MSPWTSAESSRCKPKVAQDKLLLSERRHLRRIFLGKTWPSCWQRRKLSYFLLTPPRPLIVLEMFFALFHLLAFLFFSNFSVLENGQGGFWRRPAQIFMACNTSGTQVCTELHFDWSRARVETATFKIFSRGLFLGFFLTRGWSS